MHLSFRQSYIWLIRISLLLSSLSSLSPALANPQPPVWKTSQDLTSSVVDVHSVISTSTGEPAWAVDKRPVASESSVGTSKKTTPGISSALVMIDPGHGGKDPGAIGAGSLREVDVIFPIAKQVAEILQKKGVTTQLTRDRDYFVGLNERVQMSAQAGATIFVSIHANSINNRPDVQGLETYHHHLGAELAQTVHNKIISVFNVDLQIPLNDRRTRNARFLVLRKSDIPAILVEVGYVSSPTEAQKLGQAQYQTQMARAIAQGILEYLGKGHSSK